MSAINNALSELAQQRPTMASLEQAKVAKVKRSRAWLWLVAGFAASLAVGGWAVSQQQVTVSEQVSTLTTPIAFSEQEVPSPTQKIVTNDGQVYSVPSVQSRTDSKSHVEVQRVPSPAEPEKNAPIKIAQVASIPEASVIVDTSSVMIEQVELTPQQLAEKAMQRAAKAVDSNSLKEALDSYNEVLRYTPDNDIARQKLAALYYGKGDARKAFDILQAGIKSNYEGEALRIALAKLLLKEKQTEAALTPLVHLPHNPSVDYLALRAALAQKVKQDTMALESYQSLVKLDSENARWWLGLAITQERNMDLSAAKYSYQQSLTKVGLSNQSQLFIRDRLKVLGSLEESANAN